MPCFAVLFNHTTPQVAMACHGLTAFACYAVSNADAATVSSLPSPARSAATVVAHGLIGMSIGLCAWSVLAATAGERVLLQYFFFYYYYYDYYY